MPKVVRILPAPDLTKGHFPAPGAPMPVKEPLLFRTVFANGFMIAAIGDPYEDKIHGTHKGTAAATGSFNVFVNGVGVHRTLDLTTCGDIALFSTSNVFVNGVG